MKRNFRINTLKTKAFWLDFDHSLSQIYAHINKEVIRDLKTQRSRLEMAPIKRKLT